MFVVVVSGVFDIQSTSFRDACPTGLAIGTHKDDNVVQIDSNLMMWCACFLSYVCTCSVSVHACACVRVRERMCVSVSHKPSVKLAPNAKITR